MKRLRTPLSHEDISKLKAGDKVSISGEIWTCRSGVLKRLIEEKATFPLDKEQYNTTLHSGPIVKIESTNDYRVKALSMTTSIRFNAWQPELIKTLQMKAIIAKGKIGKETKEAMKEYGCVHLSRTGTFAGAFALKIKRVTQVFWLDLGIPEALWVFEFDELGPLIVETDIYGNSCYDEVAQNVKATIPELYERLGISDFEYAEK